MSSTWELVKRPVGEAVRKIVRASEKRLRLVSPFVSAAAAAEVVEMADAHAGVVVSLVTHPSLEALARGTCDIAALKMVAARGALGHVVNLPRLHAKKLYVADDRMALVTSANLTSAGLWHQHEYGVLTSDTSVVRAMCSDIDGMAKAAHPLSLGALEEIEPRLAELAPRLRAPAIEPTDPLADEIIELLGLPAGATSVHAAFSNALLQVLASEGPLRTKDIQPHIQRLLPALCDDSLDRVCGGEHYGKLWKHRMRSAQSGLKRAGKITRTADGIWVLAV